MSGTISPRDRLQLWVNTFLLKQKENSGSVTATFRDEERLGKARPQTIVRWYAGTLIMLVLGVLGAVSVIGATHAQKMWTMIALAMRRGMRAPDRSALVHATSKTFRPLATQVLKTYPQDSWTSYSALKPLQLKPSTSLATSLCVCWQSSLL